MTSGSSAAPLVYPVKRGWLVFLRLSALGGMAVVCISFVEWMKQSPAWTPWTIAAAVLAVFTTGMIGAWGARIQRYAIEIYSDRVLYRCAWGHRELRIEDIAGYRILPTQYVRTLLIVPARKELRKISTALCYERQEEVLGWLFRHVVNLDQREEIDEIAEIASDAGLGATTDDRMERLSRAKQYTRVLNAVGFGSGVWAVFYPRPYDIALWAVIVLPAIALAMVVLFRGLVRLDGKPRSAYPDVGSALVLPPIMLFLRTFLDWRLLSWSDTWPTVMGLWILVLGVLLVCARDARRKWMLAGSAIFAALYAYGAAVYLNCRYDRSEPVVHESRVVDRHVSRGKHTSYHLVLEPFVGGESRREVQVSQEVYDKLQTGDSVRVGVFEGALGIPWFLVR